MTEYALYKGDEFIMIGTLKELSEYLRVKKDTVYFYSMPAYQKRSKGNAIVVIKL